MYPRKKDREDWRPHNLPHPRVNKTKQHAAGSHEDGWRLKNEDVARGS